MADEMARIERLSRVPPCVELLGDRREHLAAGDADIGRLVPGDQASEIGLGDIEEGIVVIGEQAGAARRARPSSRPPW